MDYKENGGRKERERNTGERRNKKRTKQTDISMNRANHRDLVRMFIPSVGLYPWFVFVAKQSKTSNDIFFIFF